MRPALLSRGFFRATVGRPNCTSGNNVGRFGSGGFGPAEMVLFARHDDHGKRKERRLLPRLLLPLVSLRVAVAAGQGRPWYGAGRTPARQT